MRILTILFLLLSQACALTAPEGSRELEAEIKADRQKKSPLSVHLGRPQYVKVRSYRKILGGDIHSDHWIYLQIGREKLGINDLIGGDRK